VAEIRTRLQGADHWQAADARRAVNELREVATLSKEGRKALAWVGDLVQKAEAEHQRAHYAESERINRTLLEIRRKWLGEDDPDTAQSYLSLALNLRYQAKYAEAEPLFRTALAICLKALGEGHPGTAASYNGVASNLDAQGKYAEAEPLHRTALAIWLKAVGEGHPHTASRYNNLAYNLARQGRYAEAEPLFRKALAIYLKALGEGHPHTAAGYHNLAYNLNAQRKYAEAEPLYRKALAIYLKALGADHPDTAQSYNSVASNLDAQGKSAEAEPFLRRGLAIRLKAVGEGHPDTAISYNNLAVNLDWQGRYAEAEPLHRRALAIRLKALGADHPYTALGYNNLAADLEQQGKYAEAEPLYRKALAIRLKAVGEGHPDTATSYNNLAMNLKDQGKSAEAELLLRRALAIWLKAVGEGHPHTAVSYNNLADNLNAQGKSAEAEPLFRTALAIRLKALGEGHPDTAAGYNNLAMNLKDQGKSAEAEPLYRTALVIYLKALGADHPYTAQSYNNLAANLDAQGKSAEAEPLYRTALAINLKALGADHPYTAQSYNNLAFNLDAQGKLAEAVANWAAAAAILELTRGARGASGLERSLNPLRPLPALAVALARQGQPREAWIRWESDLARGLLDDLSARQLRPLDPDQRRREADLAGRLQRLDELITRLIAKAHRTQDEDRQLDALRRQQSELRGQWVEFQNTLARDYPTSAGKPATLEDIQKALPPDAALVGWLDIAIAKRHWACLVHHDGAPVWVPTPGSGPEGRCTPQDHRRDRDCQIALATNAPGWRDLATAVARQRLGPLVPHLAGVRQLIVLPSPSLAAVPVEALVEALPEISPRPVVSYAPSGSMFARLGAPRSRPPGPARLLALGDPAFPRPAPSGPPPTPPDHGIAILAVAPNGTADLFGLKAGDVLLEYNGKVLKSPGDLAVVPAGDRGIRVPITLWRDGEVRSLEIAAGPLGIRSNPNRPAAQVVLAQRAAAAVLHPGARGEALASLPGTRREVQALAALFPKDQVTTLMGPDATESNLQQLARSGALKNYRFLHLATHGKANRSVALSSAVFLAAEPDGPSASADPAAPESAPDGEITAEQIVRTWELDAELVVLSACESGLGVAAGGEGYLGFAQPLFAKGARSLVLSLWKVDDRATALLMTRFYQDLLGRRAGLSGPLPKAEALDEARRWLRGLTAEEVGGELAALDRGPVRPLAQVDGPAPLDPSSRPRPTGVRPYAHPYYWASFILIGDPR
jgi:tetratricopeptide (TPR) repeat protein